MSVRSGCTAPRPRPCGSRSSGGARHSCIGRSSPGFEDLDGWTLHRLHHSALTHDAEGGTSTPMLLARSRHASVRSLERYARPGVDSVARHVTERDPTGRRRT
ncbi:hypothetical protein ACFPH6_06650 [Streptomyces xiangluensis]|uniref:Phage integrase family protein n=1 Tax=Streptomyces xiangluensis TaxID=2665720 RepID=A0ABV8YJL2_9ACTN